MNPEQFASILRQQDIPKRTLDHQIKAQVAWSKIISDILRPQIDVTEADVNSKMQRMKYSEGKTELLLL